MEIGRPSEKKMGQLSHFNIQRSRDIAAKQVGFTSGKTYERAKLIVEKATPEQIEKLNKGEKTIIENEYIAYII